MHPRENGRKARIRLLTDRRQTKRTQLELAHFGIAPSVPSQHAGVLTQMPDYEACPIYPGLRKLECSHCQGTARSSAPNFSLRAGYYKRHPTIEILKNGGPVHAWDTHFRFGYRKTEIILASIVAIREFAEARDDDERRAFRPRIIASRGLRVHVQVEMDPEFETSTGLKVDRPYLHLRALPPAEGGIGLGMSKCQAICALESELERWLKRLR